eukprot:scaffold1187_cov374-Prasinococcus_capsulatus_cf.AAC.1
MILPEDIPPRGPFRCSGARQSEHILEYFVARWPAPPPDPVPGIDTLSSRVLRARPPPSLPRERLLPANVAGPPALRGGRPARLLGPSAGEGGGGGRREGGRARAPGERGEGSSERAGESTKGLFWVLPARAGARRGDQGGWGRQGRRRGPAAGACPAPQAPPGEYHEEERKGTDGRSACGIAQSRRAGPMAGGRQARHPFAGPVWPRPNSQSGPSRAPSAARGGRGWARAPPPGRGWGLLIGRPASRPPRARRGDVWSTARGAPRRGEKAFIIWTETI